MMIDQDLPESKPMLRKEIEEKYPKATKTLAAMNPLLIISIIEGIIRIWNAVQRGRERKEKRDKETE